MSDDPNLKNRLDTFSKAKRSKPSSGFGVTALALAVGLCGAVVAYFLATDWQ